MEVHEAVCASAACGLRGQLWFRRGVFILELEEWSGESVFMRAWCFVGGRAERKG